MSERIPLPMPSGWFQVAYSHDLAPAESMPLQYFDTELVLFRTESGEAKVLDAYCPHMGAHLGYGIRDQAGSGSRVKGDSIVCPFHGWAYNGEGQCTDRDCAECRANAEPHRILRELGPRSVAGDP